jgi:hypothetical protein
MTVNTETFYPDTCQCVIALAWDDTANPVTYSGVSIVKDAPHNLLTYTAAIQCVLSASYKSNSDVLLELVYMVEHT